jgi:hypothetical protein
MELNDTEDLAADPQGFCFFCYTEAIERQTNGEGYTIVFHDKRKDRRYVRSRSRAESDIMRATAEIVKLRYTASKGHLRHESHKSPMLKGDQT